MSGIWIRAAGAWKKLTPQLRVGNTWKDVTNAWVRAGGTWKRIYPPPTPPVNGVTISATSVQRLQNITLTWNKSPNATHYRYKLIDASTSAAVYTSDFLTIDNSIFTTTSTTISITYQVTASSGCFYFSIEAQNSGGTSVATNSATFNAAPRLLSAAFVFTAGAVRNIEEEEEGEENIVLILNGYSSSDSVGTINSTSSHPINTTVTKVASEDDNDDGNWDTCIIFSSAIKLKSVQIIGTPALAAVTYDGSSTNDATIAGTANRFTDGNTYTVMIGYYEPPISSATLTLNVSGAAFPGSQINIRHATTLIGFVRSGHLITNVGPSGHNTQYSFGSLSPDTYFGAAQITQFTSRIDVDTTLPESQRLITAVAGHPAGWRTSISFSANVKMLSIAGIDSLGTVTFDGTPSRNFNLDIRQTNPSPISYTPTSRTITIEYYS